VYKKYLVQVKQVNSPDILLLENFNYKKSAIHCVSYKSMHCLTFAVLVWNMS